MKYRTFRKLVISAGLLTVVGGGALVAKAFGSSSPPPPPVPAATVAPKPAPPPVTPPPAQPLSTAEIRVRVDEFLTQHPKNNGRDKWVDCIPDAPFRATAVKFPAKDHAKYSSKDQSLWSQIRLDLNRDGSDDEKWLLKNGHTYKREVLDATGKTVGAPEYFKNVTAK